VISIRHPFLAQRTSGLRAADRAPLTEVGQIFRMNMYHPGHPDGYYQMANKVRVLDPPRAIGWLPGTDSKGDGQLEFGGWIWRYDLAPLGPAGCWAVVAQ
jgi:hypothetical protein